MDRLQLLALSMRADKMLGSDGEGGYVADVHSMLLAYGRLVEAATYDAAARHAKRHGDKALMVICTDRARAARRAAKEGR